jgi:hypothetical protein
MLFKLNTLIYTKYFGISQPRCIRYKFSKEKIIRGRVKYFYIKARYLDFNRKVLRETLSKYTIKKFYKAKQITVLKVFPLKYHLSKSYIRAYLTKYSWKFLSIIDAHYYKYKGKVFYIKKEQIIEISIKSQVVVNPPYFQKENPNYFKPSIKDNRGPWGPLPSYFDLDGISKDRLSLA